MRNEKVMFKVRCASGFKLVMCGDYERLCDKPIGFVNGEPLNDVYVGVGNVEENKK